MCLNMQMISAVAKFIFYLCAYTHFFFPYAVAAFTTFLPPMEIINVLLILFKG